MGGHVKISLLLSSSGGRVGSRLVVRSLAAPLCTNHFLDKIQNPELFIMHLHYQSKVSEHQFFQLFITIQVVQVQ